MCFSYQVSSFLGFAKKFIYLNFLPLTTVPSLWKVAGGNSWRGCAFFLGFASLRHPTKSAYLEGLRVPTFTSWHIGMHHLHIQMFCIYDTKEERRHLAEMQVYMSHGFLKHSLNYMSWYCIDSEVTHTWIWSDAHIDIHPYESIWYVNTHTHARTHTQI